MSEDAALSDSGYSTHSSHKYRSVSDSVSCHSSWSFNVVRKQPNEFQMKGTHESSLDKSDDTSNLSSHSVAIFDGIPKVESVANGKAFLKLNKREEFKEEEKSDFVWYCQAPPPPKCFPYHNNSVFLPNFHQHETTTRPFLRKLSQTKLVTHRTSRDALRKQTSRVPSGIELIKENVPLEKQQSPNFIEQYATKEKNKTQCFKFLQTGNSHGGTPDRDEKVSFVRKVWSWFVSPALSSSLKRVPNHHQIAGQSQQRKRRKL